MEFVILLLINLTFLVLVYIFFNQKIKSELETGKIRRDLEELVTLFNRNAENNITTLEAKLASFNRTIKENENLINDFKHMVVDKNDIKSLVDQYKAKIKTHEIPESYELNKSQSLFSDNDSFSVKNSNTGSGSNQSNNQFPSDGVVDDILSAIESGRSFSSLAEEYKVSVEELKLRYNLEIKSKELRQRNKVKEIK